MYQALYRKWRPKTFDDVIGQPHVTETLKRQLEGERISHAYLFIGTRGTGKTSCAKIFAKAVNCEAPQSGNPCNVCPACIGIDEGSILDVEELDAASNNGVDHVRALRDEAVFTPAAVKKRVYIIDEVHGLSTAAFNALLKILEEPPSHLLFILATTEAHKVPATIASRCQRFQFRRVGSEELLARLWTVAEAEEIALEPDAAALLARLADGSLRDALALLEQCAGSGTVDAALVRRYVGLAGSTEVAQLLSAIGGGDVEGALALVNELYYGGRDMGALLSELAILLRDILLTRIAPKGSEQLQSGNFDRETIDRFSAMTQEALLLALTQVTEASQDLGRSADRKLTVEVMVIRLCDARLSGDLDALLARVVQLEERVAAGVPVAVSVPVPVAEAPPVFVPVVEAPPVLRSSVDAPPWEELAPPPVEQKSAPRVAEEKPQVVESPKTERVSAPSVSGGDGLWEQILARVQPELDISVYTLISDGKEVGAALEGEWLNVYIENEFFRGIVEKKEVMATLETAASAVVGHKVQVRCHKAADRTTPKGSSSKLDALTQKGFGNITIK